MVEAIVFYLFAAVLILSALMVISLRNPVHSVLFLILAFFNAAGLFVLLGAEFIAMLLVIVYVGAVAVLFLFVVMMLNVSVESFREGVTKYFPVSFTLGVILLGQMLLLFDHMRKFGTITHRVAKPVNNTLTNTEQLGSIIYTDYLFIFQCSGLVLLVAMIGAIVLTFTPRTRMRKQVINNQVARRPKDTLEIVKVESGKGIS
jgi:NADH-quinone oxidoreductase subunit J